MVEGLALRGNERMLEAEELVRRVSARSHVAVVDIRMPPTESTHDRQRPFGPVVGIRGGP
jgi:hypothetical protein